MERKQPKCVEIGPGPCLACADAQATIAALEETILKMGENAAVVAKDAMAAKEQVAALQARVKELEEITKVICGHCCEPMEIPSKAVLQSALTQRTAERDTARRRVDELEAREVDVVLLRDDLEQRTAELEAANEKVQFLEKKNSNLLDSSNTVLKVKADQDVRLADLQAELERVSALVKALPKVEGEIEVSSGVYNFILLKHDSGTRFLCGQIETEQTARAIAALWQHRQGMEG